jgi:hypothetical protein
VVVAGVAVISAPGADAVAVSDSWVAWRAGEALFSAPLDPASGFVPRAAATGPVGRPALSGTLLVYDTGGRIASIDLVTGARRTLRRERRAQLRGPSVLYDQLAYVKATYRLQQVLVGPLRPQRPASDRALYGTTPTARRDAGHEPGRFPARGHINEALWRRPPAGVNDTLTTTATAADAIYVTRVRKRRGEPATPTVLRIPRVR